MRQVTVLWIAAALLAAGCSSGTTDTTVAMPSTTNVTTATSTLPSTTTAATTTTTRVVSNGVQIVLSLEDVEGLEGLNVNSVMIPLPMTQEKLDSHQPYGPTADFQLIKNDPFSGTAAYKNEDESVAEFESGKYRFIIEVYQPSGPMYFGCEQVIEVDGGEDLEVTITNLPGYTGDGLHWMLYDDLEYPECPPG